MIYQNILDLIGNTPVVYLDGIFIKLEGYNISGSVKDRPAKWMIEGLEHDGILTKGKTIVEPTSGNTGISLAMIGALKGYEVVLVMPSTMSVERQQVMKAYGAKIILTDGKLGMNGAIEEAKRLVREEGYVMPSQFENKYNVLSHEESTAQEILNDFQHIDYIVSGIGTGGTITGIGNILKKKFPNLKLIGVEPVESAILNGGTKGPHGIQGIGAGFKPDILNMEVVDDVITISTDETKEEAKKLAKKGLFLGISSAAAIKVAYNLRQIVGEDKTILAIAPDNGFKYLSTEVF